MHTANRLSIDAAALATGRSRRTIYRWIRDGILRAHDSGTALEVTLPDVMKAEARVKRGRPRGSTRGPR
ncbi:helix-turn-helix domain-containing protein [Microbacterium sp. gxy059]|uniref:helix-turn-helix domain-containing protein n=1 Tax=Microbacterium sp. gxy059 TaxID=2957199 RepID=UPI003D9687C6